MNCTDKILKNYYGEQIQNDEDSKSDITEIAYKTISNECEHFRRFFKIQSVINYSTSKLSNKLFLIKQ